MLGDGATMFHADKYSRITLVHNSEQSKQAQSVEVPKTQTSPSRSTGVLVILIVLPLVVVGFQLTLKLGETWGNVGYSLYKVFFLVPPLIYCRMKGVDILRDILILKNWRHYLSVAVGLGILALVIFWGAYQKYVFGARAGRLFHIHSYVPPQKVIPRI